MTTGDNAARTLLFRPEDGGPSYASAIPPGLHKISYRTLQGEALSPLMETGFAPVDALWMKLRAVVERFQPGGIRSVDVRSFTAYYR